MDGQIGFKKSRRCRNFDPDYLIPPLTLQLLFENAIKHNATSVSRPLTIRLYTSEGYLIVENNIRKKKTAIHSNQIGLQNIMLKYKLLDQAAVEGHSDDQKFIVNIPLITPKFDEPGKRTTANS